MEFASPVAVELPVDGVLWALQGQAGLFANARYEADTHQQRATLGHFGAPGRRIRGEAAEGRLAYLPEPSSGGSNQVRQPAKPERPVARKRYFDKCPEPPAVFVVVMNTKG